MYPPRSFTGYSILFDERPPPLSFLRLAHIKEPMSQGGLRFYIIFVSYGIGSYEYQGLLTPRERQTTVLIATAYFEAIRIDNMR